MTKVTKAKAVKALPDWVEEVTESEAQGTEGEGESGDDDGGLSEAPPTKHPKAWPKPSAKTTGAEQMKAVASAAKKRRIGKSVPFFNESEDSD